MEWNRPSDRVSRLLRHCPRFHLLKWREAVMPHVVVANLHTVGSVNERQACTAEFAMGCSVKDLISVRALDAQTSSPRPCLARMQRHQYLTKFTNGASLPESNRSYSSTLPHIQSVDQCWKGIAPMAGLICLFTKAFTDDLIQESAADHEI
jgi:hypothetical protein